MFSSQELQFFSKKQRSCQIRYPKMDDVEELTSFINLFSKEDLFTRFAGEHMSLEEERNYLQSEIDAIEAGDAVKLFCFVDKKLVGVSDVHRDTSLLTRKRHVGILGLIIAKNYRGEGIGEKLIIETINASVKQITGLKMIKLSCFANNISALSLYQKIGFEEVGRVPNSLFYKNEYVDEIIMTKQVVTF